MGLRVASLLPLNWTSRSVVLSGSCQALGHPGWKETVLPFPLGIGLPGSKYSPGGIFVFAVWTMP